MNRIVILAVAAALAGGGACLTDTEIGNPLSIELTGPETGLVGDSVSFFYAIQGRSLQGIIFMWGDGAQDSIPTVGAQSASGTQKHAFQEPGSYLVRARVEDAVEGVANAEVTVTIEGS